MSIEDRNGHLHGSDGRYREKTATAPGAAAALNRTALAGSDVALEPGGMYGYDSRGDL